MFEDVPSADGGRWSAYELSMTCQLLRHAPGEPIADTIVVFADRASFDEWADALAQAVVGGPRMFAQASEHGEIRTRYHGRGDARVSQAGRGSATIPPEIVCAICDGAATPWQLAQPSESATLSQLLFRRR